MLMVVLYINFVVLSKLCTRSYPGKKVSEESSWEKEVSEYSIACKCFGISISVLFNTRSDLQSISFSWQKIYGTFIRGEEKVY